MRVRITSHGFPDVFYPAVFAHFQTRYGIPGKVRVVGQLGFDGSHGAGRGERLAAANALERCLFMANMPRFTGRCGEEARDQRNGILGAGLFAKAALYAIGFQET